MQQTRRITYRLYPNKQVKYKLDEAGGVFVDVPLLLAPSQTCPSCGKKEKKELSERVHNCECGCKLDRDVAAAQVMLNYARGLGTSLLNADVAALFLSLRNIVADLGKRNR